MILTNLSFLWVYDASLIHPTLATIDQENLNRFKQGLQEICDELAEAIVKDGEGAPKLMRIVVESALDELEARTVGKTIAHSP